MGIERYPRITIENHNKEKVIKIGDLEKHLKEMGLQTSTFDPCWVEFAEFDISNKGVAAVEVKRPDGNLTRCCLIKSFDTLHSYVYLNIHANIKPDEKNGGIQEVSGIFPVPIIGVGSSQHLTNYGGRYYCLNFITSNGGWVGITENGTIDFEQGKF